MKTINLLDTVHIIINEFESAVCIMIHGINAYNVNKLENVEINFGQQIFNLKLLESGSVIFTINENSEDYIVVTSINMFGVLSKQNIKEIKRLKKVSNDALIKIQKIFDELTTLS